MKKLVIFLCKLSVVSGILYYLLQKIEFAKIIQVMLSTKISYVVIAFVLALVIRYLAAYQTKILLAHQKIFLSTSRVFIINLTSTFYTLFLPGDLSGGVVKWYKFSKLEGKRAQSFSVVVTARLINTLVITGIGLIALLAENPFRTTKVFLLIFPMSILLFLSFLPIFSKSASSIAEKYFINSLIKISPGKIKEKLEKVWQNLKDFQELSRSDMIYILFIAITTHCLGTIGYCALALSVNLKLSLIVFAWLRSVSILVQMVPISISGLGVREGALVFLLSKYHVAGAQAMAFSFLLFAVAILISLIGGIFELKELFEKQRG